MSLYRRVTCTKGGTCNTNGPSGLCSKCGKSPTGGAWWYRFRFGGRIVHESAKTTSKTVARDAERARRRQFEETWNRIEKRTLPPRFDQAATSWLAEVRPHLAERTKDVYGVALDCHLVPEIGSLLLCDVSAQVIAHYQAKRKAENASARTLNKELHVLRQILKRHRLWANLQGDVKFERESEGLRRSREMTHVCSSEMTHRFFI